MTRKEESKILANAFVGYVQFIEKCDEEAAVSRIAACCEIVQKEIGIQGSPLDIKD